MKNYEHRIKALESIRLPFPDIIELIKKGKHYDELDELQKNHYCQMIGTPREIFEETELAVVGNLHALLKNSTPPTPKELEAIIFEIETFLFYSK